MTVQIETNERFVAKTNYLKVQLKSKDQLLFESDQFNFLDFELKDGAQKLSLNFETPDLPNGGIIIFKLCHTNNPEPEQNKEPE